MRRPCLTGKISPVMRNDAHEKVWPPLHGVANHHARIIATLIHWDAEDACGDWR